MMISHILKPFHFFFFLKKRVNDQLVQALKQAISSHVEHVIQIHKFHSIQTSPNHPSKTMDNNIAHQVKFE